MKICPQCKTKYTDDTLKFCLQDGSKLDSVNSEQTLVFNQDSLANAETIAENFSDHTRNYSAETAAFAKRQTNPDRNAGKNLTSSGNQYSQETIIGNVSGRKYADNKQYISAEDVKTQNSRRSFLTGFLIGIVLIAIIGGGGILAAVFLPGILSENTNNNTSANTAETEKEVILSDSAQVKVSASTVREIDHGNTYYPAHAFDANSRTAWCEGAKGTGIGQWIAFDFKEETVLKKIIMQPGYFKTKQLWQDNNRLAAANLKFSDGTIKTVFFPDEMKEQKIDIDDIKTKSVIITIKDVYRGDADAKDTLISEVKFVVEK